MTKVYVVHRYNTKLKSNFVSRVFTNRKLANNYARWMQETSKNENVFYYITTYDICRLDFKEIPF